MKNKSWILIAVACLSLYGCGGGETDAKQAVRDSLKDPDSAKFGKFSDIDGRLGCMTVNARNALGGYTGDKQALLKKMDGKWTFYSIVDTPHESCVSNWPLIDRELSADDLLRTACAEQSEVGGKYSEVSAGICQYGSALSDREKLAFVDAWNEVKRSLSQVKSIEAEGQAKGYIQ